MKTTQMELALHSMLFCTSWGQDKNSSLLEVFTYRPLLDSQNVQLGLFFFCFVFLKEGWECKQKRRQLYTRLPNKHSGKSLSRKLNLSFSKWYIFPTLPVLCGMIHSLYKEVMKPRKHFTLEKTQCTVVWIQTFGIHSNSQCIGFLPLPLPPLSIVTFNLLATVCFKTCVWFSCTHCLQRMGIKLYSGQGSKRYPQ